MKLRSAKILLSTSLLFSTSLSSVTFATATESQVEVNEDKPIFAKGNFILLKDTDTEIIYRIKKNGVTYQFEENIVINGERSVNTIREYKILSSSSVAKKEKKILLSTNIQVLIENEEGLFIERKDGTLYKIGSESEDSKKKLNFQLEGIKEEKIAYIVDAGYRTFDDHTAEVHMNGASPYYKYCNDTNYNYGRYQVYVDDLSSQEHDLYKIGAIGVIDGVLAAIRKGELFSMKLLRKVFKELGEGIPGLGAIYTIYNYCNTYMDARNEYKLIPAITR